MSTKPRILLAVGLGKSNGHSERGDVLLEAAKLYAEKKGFPTIQKLWKSELEFQAWTQEQQGVHYLKATPFDIFDALNEFSKFLDSDDFKRAESILKRLESDG